MEDLIEVKTKYGKMYFETYDFKSMSEDDYVWLYDSDKKGIDTIPFLYLYEYGVSSDKMKNWLIEQANKSNCVQTFLWNVCQTDIEFIGDKTLYLALYDEINEETNRIGAYYLQTTDYWNI